MRISMKQFTIQGLITDYNKEQVEDKEKILEHLMQKLLLEGATEDEYIEIFKIPYKGLQMIVVYKCKPETLENLLLNCQNSEVIPVILERMKNENVNLPYSQMFSSKSAVLIFEAIPHVTKEKIIKKVVKEENNRNVKKMLQTLEGKIINTKDAEKLFRSCNSEVRLFAVRHASKTQIVEKMSREDSQSVIDEMLNILEKCGYIPNEYEIENLITSKNIDVRGYAYKFVNSSRLVKQAKEEEEIGILIKISRIMKNQKLKALEANELVDSRSRLIRECAYKYASLDVISKKLEEEKEESLVRIIINRLSMQGLNEKDANFFIESTHDEVRRFASKYVSVRKLYKTLLHEENEDVVKSCIEYLESKNGINEQKANYLLDASSPITRGYAMKFAAKNKILKRLAVETDESIINEAIRCYTNIKSLS